MTPRAVQPSPVGVPGAVTDPTNVSAEELTFAGAGGTQVNGYLTAPAAAGPHPGIVVIHEAGGLGDHIRDVANRFANIGYTASPWTCTRAKAGRRRWTTCRR
jgi:cephalosporin-C deacetylase-like acetyl esterase